jgi:iron complex outermembrane receptor protein
MEWGDYSLSGEVSAHAQSASIVGFEMIPSEVQKTYAVTNFAVTLAPAKGHWSVVAFINNLADKRPYGSAYYDSTMGIIGASVGAPRTWGVRGAHRF